MLGYKKLGKDSFTTSAHGMLASIFGVHDKLGQHKHSNTRYVSKTKRELSGNVQRWIDKVSQSEHITFYMYDKEALLS